MYFLMPFYLITIFHSRVATHEVTHEPDKTVTNEILELSFSGNWGGSKDLRRTYGTLRPSEKYVLIKKKKPQQ